MFVCKKKSTMESIITTTTTTTITKCDHHHKAATAAHHLCQHSSTISPDIVDATKTTTNSMNPMNHPQQSLPSSLSSSTATTTIECGSNRSCPPPPPHSPSPPSHHHHHHHSTQIWFNSNDTRRRSRSFSSSSSSLSRHLSTSTKVLSSTTTSTTSTITTLLWRRILLYILVGFILVSISSSLSSFFPSSSSSSSSSSMTSIFVNAFDGDVDFDVSLNRQQSQSQQKNVPTTTSIDDDHPFQIPDQQAYIGKLFYYRIVCKRDANVYNLTLSQAGGHQPVMSISSPDGDGTQVQSLLPDWLHFDSATGELFGVPQEKRIYFIQMQAYLQQQQRPTTMDNHQHRHYQSSEPPRLFEDIFVIEILDSLAYLPSSLLSSSSSSLFSSSLVNNDLGTMLMDESNLVLHQCRIELKNDFTSVAHLYQTLVQLRGSNENDDESVSQSSSGLYHPTDNLVNHHNDDNDKVDQVKEWLSHFRVITTTMNHHHDRSLMNDPSTDTPATGIKLTYAVDRCGVNTNNNSPGTSSSSSSSSSSHIYLDADSQRLLTRLGELHIESELIKISSLPLSSLSLSSLSESKSTIPFDTSSHQQQKQQHKNELDFELDLDSSQSLEQLEQKNHQHHSHHHNHGHHRGHHRRRNAYVDDDNIYGTPSLKQNPATIQTTSTIDLNQLNSGQSGQHHNHHNHHHYALSRTLIPSMVSPTFTGGSTDDDGGQPPLVRPTPVYHQPGEDTNVPVSAYRPSIGGSGGQQQHNHHHHGNFRVPQYPHLYSTPVLLPDISSQITHHSLDQFDSLLITPVLPGASISKPAPTSPSLIQPSEPIKVVEPSPVPIPPAASVTTNPPDVVGSKEKDTSNESTTSTTTTTSSSTTEAVPTTKPNRRPYVNKRISKLSITAGKYWQFTIPEKTFMDVEDGNTRNLRLAFFKDSNLPPIDYWIQFDHENQYLYALPTEDNIGKYRFNLVAIDSAGADVVEILEIYVRQARQSLAYTHRFVLGNITWHPDTFVERIQAVSTLLQRMATQIFEEASSANPNEAIQRQAILHSIAVLSIQLDSDSSSWTIVWSNDSLRRHPCPIDEINKLYTKLYDITYPADSGGYMTPSVDLRNALSPEFRILRVRREFIGRSACGNHKVDIESSTSATRPKEKIVFSNRIQRLGPYKLGEAFRFQIPKDTVYSVNRQVDTRDLHLSLEPVSPECDATNFIYFDVREQTIYGLPYKPEHIHSCEIQLMAEDPVTGDRARDLFVIDVVHDANPREDNLFEVTMSFLIKNVERVVRSQLWLTPKDHYQVVHLIATRLIGDTNLEAIRMLEINRHRFSSISNTMDTGVPGGVGVGVGNGGSGNGHSNKKLHRLPDSDGDDSLQVRSNIEASSSLPSPSPSSSPSLSEHIDKFNGEKEEEEEEPDTDTDSEQKLKAQGAPTHRFQHHMNFNSQNNNSHKNAFNSSAMIEKRRKRRSKHHHHKHNHHDRYRRDVIDFTSDYFYEFIWTNRSLVTSYLPLKNMPGEGVGYETAKCPKDIIHTNVYDRLFPGSAAEFQRQIHLMKNETTANLANFNFNNNNPNGNGNEPMDSFLSSSTDTEAVMELYALLFEQIEANVEFLCVEWHSQSTCSIDGPQPRTLGAKPIREMGGDLDDNNKRPGSGSGTESGTDGGGKQSSQESQNVDSGGSPGGPVTTIIGTDGKPVKTNANGGGGGQDDDDEDNLNLDLSTTQIYLGEKLLTIIIPPIAIMTALLFAVLIGCCFHRANKRRKAMGTMQEVTEENPNLYRQRIPIQFEFERVTGHESIRGAHGGGNMGMGGGYGEQESMLDSKLSRHPIQIMPMKRGGGGGGGTPMMPSSSSSYAHRHGPGGGLGPKSQQHGPYQMLPQQ